MAFLNRGKINSKELKFPIYLNALTKNLSKNLSFSEESESLQNLHNNNSNAQASLYC